MLQIKPNETNLEFAATKNTTFVLKRKSAGATILFRCLDAQRLPASLKNCTVTLSARRINAVEAAFKDQPCAVHSNQFDHAGEASFTFDEATADLAPGDYHLEIKAVDKNGAPRYYPSNQMEGFARLVVHDSIS